MILNVEIGVFMDFLAISGYETHFKSELRMETCTRGHQRTVPLWKSLFYRCWPV